MKILVLILLFMATLPAEAQFECDGLEVSGQFISWYGDSALVFKKLTHAGYRPFQYREPEFSPGTLNARIDKTDSTEAVEISVNFTHNGQIIRNLSKTTYFEKHRFNDFKNMVTAVYSSIGEQVRDTDSYVVQCDDGEIQVNLWFGVGKTSITEQFMIFRLPNPIKQ